MPACHSLTTALPLLLYCTAGKDRRIVAQRNPGKIEGMEKKKKKNTSRAHKVFDKFQEKNRKK